MMSEKNREHNAYMITKVQCPCGTITARCNMTVHRKTKKHQKWVNDQVINMNDEDIERLKVLLFHIKKKNII